MNREPEPMEQIDYGIGYKGVLSPQQHMTLKVEGGILAIALSLLALGAILSAAILLPNLINSSAKAASANADSMASIANRESRLAQADLQRIRRALERNHIKVDDN